MPPKSKDPVEPVAPPAEVTEGSAIGTWSVDEPAAAEPARPVQPFMSEGMRHDLETVGWAVDPTTGGKFERDKETGKVTYTDRAGNVTELD